MSSWLLLHCIFLHLATFGRLIIQVFIYVNLCQRCGITQKLSSFVLSVCLVGWVFCVTVVM